MILLLCHLILRYLICYSYISAKFPEQAPLKVLITYYFYYYYLFSFICLFFTMWLHYHTY